ncbi:hypothetical protein ACQ46_gp177 [Citrobacter phage Moon]|uniref:Uncharacterized protein n=1 Tax=Citrobacter phage Moon TaxID=1540095 RepID=A0A0A0YR66_9CAUD|nr:hypothetical protein ACQ46_gp177 [Citrobacter phage Moon]AIX12247.1 hypothetical protein CPT_Moon276 [Citrobacter phage Moon]
MSHNLENVVEFQRSLEGIMNKLALGDMVDYSFDEAIKICHWMGRRVRPVGAEWYIIAEKKETRYALWIDSGDREYITQPDHIMQRWEVLS